MKDISYASALKLVDLIRSKALSPVELMETTLERIETVNPVINAFVSIHAEHAMEQAKGLAERIASGNEIPPLAGIPIGVKDLEDVEGMVTSYGAVPYRNHVAVRDSIQVERLKAAGAIVVGKTNTPEFGFTFFTKNRVFGVTRNPWNTERTPGGSSGGSAASVAGGMVPMATGSDGGGSIRIPASYSGCFGLKPSYGRIPIYSAAGPLSALPMNPIVVAGPLARTVEDAALYMDCAAGYHPADPNALPKPEASYFRSLNDFPRKLRIAFSPDIGYVRVQKDVLALVEKAAGSFEEMGHEVELWKDVLPDVGDAWSKLIYCDFFAQLYPQIDTHRDELAKSLVMIIEGMQNFSLSDQVKAMGMKAKLNQILWELFDRFDLLLTPTMPTEAFQAKGPPPSEVDGQPISLFEAVAFSYPFNLSGHPAATVPAGLTESGLPAGLQIVGPRHRDDLVLQASYAFQQARPWADKWPEIS
jgi:aspartyl-tRNA(Asn)/glutamyl-tRNA(Gln) amidotransferase subunit A